MEQPPLTPVGPDDGYEPPPHLFAILFRPVAIFWGHVEWRWKWRPIRVVLFETLAYLAFLPMLGKHLPAFLKSDARREFYYSFHLVQAAQEGRAQFLKYLGWEELYAIVYAPLTEEILFRGLPILLARWLLGRLSSDTGRWAAGVTAVIATLAFAWAHNPHWGNLPLPQLILGIAAWMTAWRWGLRYSMLLHFSVNLGASLIPAVVIWRIAH